MAYFAQKIHDNEMKSGFLNKNEETYLKALGEAIRAMRKEKGLSQEELAYHATVDRSHMGRIERGERNVTFRNLIRISRGLGCLPSEILNKAGL